MDKEAFALRQPEMIGEQLFKKYAVLVPLVKTPAGTMLIFEKRSHKLRRQPNEICFPGGRLEPGESPELCATRETQEELMIEPHQIGIFGPSDIFVSPFNFVIYPYIGIIQDYRFTYNPEEVAEIITVPLHYFLTNNPENYKGTLVNQLPGDFPFDRIPGGENYPWASGTHNILFYQHHHHLIWGITALIIQSAAELIDRYQLD